MVSEQNSKFAPAGYVSETVGISSDSELDIYLKNTFDAMGAPEVKFVNINSVTGGTIFGGGMCLVMINKQLGAYGTIKAIRYSVDNDQVREWNRLIYNNLWHGWDWINPPMIPGVEYRTIERWGGKPVYTKLVNFGEVGAGESTFSVSFGNRVVRGSAVHGSAVLPFDGFSAGSEYSVRIAINSNNVYISVGADAGTHNLTIQCWYIKD